jgi:hypothetical protein
MFCLIAGDIISELPEQNNFTHEIISQLRNFREITSRRAFMDRIIDSA